MTLLLSRTLVEPPARIPHLLRQGLVGYWPLDEASGSRADRSGNGNTLTDNATVTGNPGPSSHIPLASQFTKLNGEYLSLADNAFVSIPNVSFHISLWAYTDTLLGAGEERYLVSKTSAVAGEYEVLGYDTGIAMGFKAYLWKADLSANTAVAATSFGALSTGTWYKVDVWYDQPAATWNIQINNGAINSTTVAGANVPSDTATGVASGRTLRSGSGTVFWDGRIAAVMFRKAVPTPAQGRWLYNKGQGRSRSEMRLVA